MCQWVETMREIGIRKVFVKVKYKIGKYVIFIFVILNLFYV